jgi:hypothetical protein
MKRLTEFTILFAILIMTGCQSSSIRTIEYYEQERSKIEMEVKNILSSLGFVDFSIFVYCHVNPDGPIISQEKHLTKYNGKGFNPENPIGLETMHGSVIQRFEKVNYDHNSKNEYLHMNMSILIIIDELTLYQKNEVIKIFESYILNIERNDTIYVVSRKELSQ